MYINMPVAVYLDGHIYMPVAGKGIQMQYGILLATFKRNDSSVHCLIQEFHKLQTADGQALTNPYDCPLLELSQQSSVQRQTSSVTCS